jgi:hypothetical protein
LGRGTLSYGQAQFAQLVTRPPPQIAMSMTLIVLSQL